MTLPVSGPMTAAMINVELGRVSTAAFDINGSAERALAGVPSGAIAFSDFYGKSAGGGSSPFGFSPANYYGLAFISSSPPLYGDRLHYDVYLHSNGTLSISGLAFRNSGPEFANISRSGSCSGVSGNPVSVKVGSISGSGMPYVTSYASSWTSVVSPVLLLSVYNAPLLSSRITLYVDFANSGGNFEYPAYQHYLDLRGEA